MLRKNRVGIGATDIQSVVKSSIRIQHYYEGIEVGWFSQEKHDGDHPPPAAPASDGDGSETNPYLPFECLVVAAFVVRWSAGRSKDATFDARMGTLYGAETVETYVICETLVPHDTATRKVGQPAVEVARSDGDELSTLLAQRFLHGGDSSPLSVITVAAWMPPTVRGLWVETDDGCEPVPNEFSRFHRFLLDAAGQAMLAAVHEHSEDVTVGPLCLADLVGDGLVHFEFADVAFQVVISSLPPLGSFGIDDDWNDGDLEQWNGPAISTSEFATITMQRTTAWMDRGALRAARAEFTEAIVAYEAGTERIVWFAMELVLLDHGWTSKMIRKHDKATTKNVLANLQAHLGGSSSDWLAARQAFDGLFNARNRLIHRGEEGDLGAMNAAIDAFAAVSDVIEAQAAKPEVLKRHPFLSYMFAPDALATGLSTTTSERLGEILNAQPLTDLTKLNDLVSFAWRPSSDRANTNNCWTKTPTIEQRLSIYEQGSNTTDVV